ncbi:dipeptidyl-peptidase-4 [Kribbella sp. VKM Ac-2527]|uniref:Dipeptidyl-peptidase-4 n=1 Tax=Kribbella caucasensis TaxID=2512215 RepID=A0A4R6KF58_9ACTN|nr:prolyl oligopeptidase family serine peptidase [Kribbella sp. VKM Ac-2527]TDO49098.1 dipeptidyl-peptidase-4 [Kribbella sp. VKM Ac-2527]
MDTTEYPTQSARTQRFTLGVPRSFTLSPDGERVLFLRTRGPEDRASCLWMVDSDGEQLLVAPEQLGADGPIPEAELVRRERTRERSGGVVAYSADAAVRTIVFAVNGRLWTLVVGETPRLIPTQGSVVDPRIDPTGRRVAYVSDRSLRVVELADGNDRLVAGEDDPEVSWGLAEHVAAESMHRTRGHWWSPDGTRLLAARVDLTPVQRWWIADPANPDRPPREIPYPAAGSDNALVSLHVLDLSGTAIELDWDRKAFEYVVSAGWDTTGPLASVQSRDQRTLLVLAADPDSGKTSVLHEQRDPAWVEIVPGTPARTASGKVVHTVDDTTVDTRRLTMDGLPVTPAGLQIREVLEVSGESVLFEAIDEPTEHHLWLYDESGLRRLTDEPGVHTGTRAGDTVLVASNTEAGRAFVVRKEGSPDREITSLGAKPVLTPRITWLRAGAQELRTAVLLPSWYEPGRSLPVLMAPYGGPAGQLVLRASGAWFTTAQWYAEAGFAVIIADGRGTPGRGPAWDKTVHGDTLTAPLEDQAIALRAAAENCPDLDLNRVGITGWSYGGTLAAAAVLRMPDVFHAAISGAAPSDQRLYDTHWRERFLGHPDDNPEAYDRSSPISDAAKLRRPLLLVHGLADDNVVAAHALRMSAALLAAGRPHQVLPLSGATHMPTEEAAVEGLMRHQLQFLQDALGS